MSNKFAVITEAKGFFDDDKVKYFLKKDVDKIKKYKEQQKKLGYHGYVIDKDEIDTGDF